MGAGNPGRWHEDNPVLVLQRGVWGQKSPDFHVTALALCCVSVITSCQYQGLTGWVQTVKRTYCCKVSANQTLKINLIDEGCFPNQWGEILSNLFCFCSLASSSLETKDKDILPPKRKWVLSLPENMATHSSVLAWRIPGTGEPGGLPSMGSHRVGHDWSDLAAVAAAVFL